MTISILEAEQDDIIDILPLLEKFSEEYPIETSAKHFHPQAGTTLLYHCIFNGVLYVARDGDEVVGMIGGTISLNPFTISSLQLQELFWYVNEDYRNGRVALKLYKKYVEHAKWLISEGQIVAASMATLTTTPQSAVSLVERDFKRMETSYITFGDNNG